MDHKIKLNELNKETLEKLEAYMQDKTNSKPEDHEKIKGAKDDWQLSWNKLMETLLVLEHLEI